MAKSLGEVLKQRLAAQPDAQALGAGMQGAGQQAADVLRAKSGKAVTPGGPAQTSLAEQQAAQMGLQQLDQVQQAGEVKGLQQQQQAEEQQQAADLQGQELQQRRQQFKQQSDRQTKELLNDFNRSVEQQDFKKAAASAEQASILAKLSDDKYITNLQMEGQKNRLDDALSFKEQMANDEFSFAKDLLTDNLDFKSLMDADDREFAEKLAKMDIRQAEKILGAQIAASQQNAIYSGIQDMLSGGIAAGTKLAKELGEE